MHLGTLLQCELPIRSRFDVRAFWDLGFFFTWLPFMALNDKRILKQGPWLIEIELLHDRACYVLVWGVATRLTIRRGPGGPGMPL